MTLMAAQGLIQDHIPPAPVHPQEISWVLLLFIILLMIGIVLIAFDLVFCEMGGMIIRKSFTRKAFISVRSFFLSPYLRRIIGADITSLQRFTTWQWRMEIRGLHLSNLKITDNDLLLVVAAFPNLKSLNLDNTLTTDNGLSHLPPLRKLEELSLCRSKITDEGLVYLAALPRLKTLRIAGAKITDNGLPHLELLSALEMLSIDDTRAMKWVDTDCHPAMGWPGGQIRVPSKDFNYRYHWLQEHLLDCDINLCP